MSTTYPCGTILSRPLPQGKEEMLFVLRAEGTSPIEALIVEPRDTTDYESLSVPIEIVSSSAPAAERSAKHLCKLTSRVTASQSEHLETKGQVSAASKELVLRELVKHQAEHYFSEVHQPKISKPFSFGDRITYAGRVYDFEDMGALLDASLDFWLTTGRFSEEFEKSFASFLGLRFSCLVNSGSSANLIAFASLTSPLLKERQIKAGDEVITVAAGFPTTVAPIIQYGCVPVFCDIVVSDGTYNIDVSQLEAARSERTRAVMLAHTLGNPFNLRAVTDFCAKYNLWLIEDNCDALGARYNGQLTGTFGDLATSSFYPPHHMTMGEGGAVYSKHLKFKRIVESFRDWGRDCWCAAGKDNTCGIRFDQQLGTLPRGYDHKYIYRHFGFNVKATDMQAAIGCSQLRKLPNFIERRQHNWKYLRSALASLEDLFILPNPTENSDPSWFGFLLTLRPDVAQSGHLSRDTLVRALEAKNIQTRMLFAGNLLRQPCFDEMRGRQGSYRTVGDLSQSDLVLSNAFWLGVYPGLSVAMLDAMASELHILVGRKL